MPPAIAEQLLAQRAWLRGLAREIAGEGDADDVAQDAWLVALEDPPEERGGLRPWLAGVVRHLASGMRRGRGRRALRGRRSAHCEALPSTVELVERLDTERRLARALSELEEPYRTTLLLRFHEGLPAAEIARRKNVPEGTVRWRTKHGLAELRARLTREHGGEEALGVALLDLIHGSKAPAATTGASTGAAGAAGATAMVGVKAIAAGVVVLGTLATWVAIERQGPARLPVKRVGGEPRLSAAEFPSSEPVAGTAAATLEPPGTSSPPEPNRVPLRASDIARLHVLESDGRPNAELNAVLAPRSGDERALAKATDAQGWVEFPASGERRTIAIERTGVFPYRTEVDLVPGETTIVLPSPIGLDLAGRVVVDGKAPARPLWLLLFAARSADDTVNTDDRGCLVTWDVTYGSTDAEGRFRFLGLAPGQGLNLLAPEGYVRPGMRSSGHHDRTVFHFERPADGLVLELHRQPIVYGRVVEADGVTPVAGAYVEIQLNHGVWGRDTDADGTFEIFTGEPPSSAVVRYGKSAAERHWEFGPQLGVTTEFHFPQPSDDTDLGDLVLPASSGLFLEVRDPQGNAIAGAETNASKPTDALGRARVEGTGEGAELVIARRGYRTAFVEVPHPVPAFLPVVLEPTNDLTVEVRDAAGDPQAGIGIELAAPEWFFTGEGSRGWSGLDDLPRHSSHEGQRGSVWGGKPARVRFHTNREGRCSMGELSPAFALHLSVLDDLGTILHEQDLAPLGPTETRVVRVRIDAVTGFFRGRVLDERDQPIVEAEVQLSVPGSDETHSHPTGNDGRFRFARVAGQSFRLAVTKRGFLPLVRESFRLPAGDLDLVLERGAEVLVRVLDSEDRPFVQEAPPTTSSITFTAGGRTITSGSSSAEPKVRARPQGATDWISADPIQDGVFELAGLATVPHEIELELSVGVLHETWAPPQREVVFRLDPIGAVELAWNLAPDPDAASYHVRLEPVAGGPARELHLSVTPRWQMSFQLFAGDYEVVLVAERPTPDGGRRGEDVGRWPLAVGSGETVHLEIGP